MRLKIVYIDDEPDLCQMFHDNFGGSPEVEIKSFVDLELAFKEIATDRPDLIFLDYRLQGTTAYEIALRLDPQLPMALITGELDLKLQLPFVKIFLKPFDFGEMEAFIQSYWDRKNLG
jgi:DNA-binding NtrC family response regulator